MRNFKSQLKSLITGGMLAAAGGFVYVTTNGGTAKVSLTDADGTTIANPLALTNGSFDFSVADGVGALDLYIQAPTGHCSVVKNVQASGNSSIFVDTSQVNTTLVIPFHFDDQTSDNVETLCGFTQIGAVQPNLAVDVLTPKSGAVVNFGIEVADSGDINGYLSGLSLAATGYIKSTAVNGSVTTGVLVQVQDSANAGDAYPEQNISEIGKEFSYQLSSGADTAAGFFIIPMQLPVSSL